MKNKELANKIIDYRYKSKLDQLVTSIDFMLNGKFLKQKTISQKDAKAMLNILKRDIQK